MIDKGLKSGSVEKVAAELRAQASSGELDLGVTERAVEMFGPNMGKLASLSEESGHEGASSELDRYILS